MPNGSPIEAAVASPYSGLSLNARSSPGPSAPSSAISTGAASPHHSHGRQRGEGGTPVGNSSSATLGTSTSGADAHSPIQPIQPSAGSGST